MFVFKYLYIIINIYSVQGREAEFLLTNNPQSPCSGSEIKIKITFNVISMMDCSNNVLKSVTVRNLIFLFPLEFTWLSWQAKFGFYGFSFLENKTVLRRSPSIILDKNSHQWHHKSIHICKNFNILKNNERPWISVLFLGFIKRGACIKN